MTAIGAHHEENVGAWSTKPLPPSIGIDELLRGCRRVVVVTPHPDDETLGVGGLLAMLQRRQFPTCLILVTDGEASHSEGDGWTPEALRVARPLEWTLALRELGWTHPQQHHLHWPDSAVAAHEAQLAHQLKSLVREGDHVFTTWQHDGHPDHEATSRAVWVAVVAKQCACTQFPVWSHSRLLHDGDARAGVRMRRLDIYDTALQCKRNALRAYRSQMVDDPISGAPPVVPPAMVRRFLVPFELLIL